MKGTFMYKHFGQKYVGGLIKIGTYTYLFMQYSCVLAKVISGNAVLQLLFFHFVHDLVGVVIIAAISSLISSWECCTDTMFVLSAVFKNEVLVWDSFL